MKNTMMLVVLAMTPALFAQDCKTVITTDVQAVVADLSAIALQAKAQQFPQAVDQLAADLEAILPLLTRPDQLAVEKFLTDLDAAVSASGPGGTKITSVERVVLTNDLLAIVNSTGMTESQMETILTDLAAVTASLSGISAAQLQNDIQKLKTDLRACVPAKP